MLNRLLAMRNRKKKGFTLIELIVVIAILAIIAALAIPAYNNLRTQSAQKIADANARTVYTGAKAAIALGVKENTDVASETGVSQALIEKVTTLTGTYSYAGGVATWTGIIDGNSVEGKYPRS